MIVDSITTLNTLIDSYKDSVSFLIPVHSDNRKHRSINTVCCLYFYNTTTDQEFILPLRHPDKLIEVTDLSFINTGRKIFTYNSQITNAVNIDALHYISSNKSIDYDSLLTQAHSTIYNKYWKLDNVNNFIPLTKHLEYCRKIKNTVIDLIDNTDSILDTYTNKIIPIFRSIEDAGLVTNNGIEYSQYNLWSITGRPSNAYNGINYAALNKEDGTRERFVSRFKDGKIVEFDFDAYHLRLIAKLIDFKFPDESIHSYLGRFYFDKEVLTRDEYNQSKSVTFRILYGGVPSEFENIPFFSKMKSFIYELWDIYKRKGYIETPIYKRKIYSNNLSGRDIKPQTLFNYMIQAMETEQNIVIMEDIQSILKDYQSKLILYTYDALLFDIHPSETNLLNTIRDKMLYPVKCKVGRNYNDMISHTFANTL